jgi:hypothetical protein
MSIEDYDNMAIDESSRDKKDCESALNETVRDFMENPFRKLRVSCYRFNANVFYNELIKILKPYGFTVYYKVFNDGDSIEIELRKRKWFNNLFEKEEV